MADIVDRLTEKGFETPGKIHTHAFGSALVLLAFGDVSRGQIISAFTLVGNEVTQLDAIIAVAGSTLEDKARFAQKVEASINLITEGLLTKAQAKTILGL